MNTNRKEQIKMHSMIWVLNTTSRIVSIVAAAGILFTVMYYWTPVYQ